MSLAVKPMLFTSSGASGKPGDGFSDQFPVGLRVLVVDDDKTCLRIMEIMLKNCLYEVTKCDRAELALEYLRDKKNGFDIVISDVHMPDMDGFKLLEHVGLEMDLPVIMMSADESKDVVMKGVTHGACDYLIKPVRMEALKNIWQHVVRRRKQDGKDKEFEQSGGVDDGEQEKLLEDVDYSSSANEGNVSKKRKDEDDDDADERDDSSALKKPRVVWSSELHQQFMIAVNQLGIDKAVPKKILELMNVPGLTRENVASHLQKYRLYLRRLHDTSSHPLGLNNSFIGTHDATFGRISPVGGLDFQAFVAATQFSPQNLATIQAAALGRVPTNSSLSVPLPDQRNIFNFENSSLRLGEGQQQQISNGKQINLLHGIPTNMDSKQLAVLQQSAQSFGNMNMQGHSQAGQNSPLMTQMVQLHPQSRPQSGYTAHNGNHILNLPSNVGHSGLSVAGPSTLFCRNEIENSGRPGHPSILQPSNAVEFSRGHNTEFPIQNFSTMNNSGISNLTPQGMLREIGSEMRWPRSFAPNYGVISGLNQNMNQGWGFQSAGSTFEAPNSSMQGGLGISPSASVQQEFSSDQKSGLNKNAVVNNGPPNDELQLNPSFPPSSLISDTGRLPNTSFQTGLFSEPYQDEDLMSALLKQEPTDPVENEFGFGAYSLDNLSS